MPRCALCTSQAHAGLTSPARKAIEAISDDDNARTVRMGASSEAPAFFLAASTALSAVPIATLKNWKVGALFVAGRQGVPSAGIIGFPGMVIWTTHPAADSVSIMKGLMRCAEE